MRKFWREARGDLFLGGGGESILLKGAQLTPVRPSDKDRMRVKTLGWRVVQSCGRDGGIIIYL
jgi:hypothetical protein